MSWKDSYETWRNYANLAPDLRAELDTKVHDEAALEDAFYQPMSFGTAGMRGILGAGINRMNIYTVRQATEGLAKFMDTLTAEERQRGVAISFDSRHNSELFAHEAARVLGAHGIQAYVFDGLRPTPELSFTVRHLKTYAGIMITASHNPKEYNGYKIYGEDGGQMPPKESDLITGYIREVTDVFGVKVATESDLIAAGTLKIIGEDVDSAYLAAVKTVTINQNLIDTVGKDMKLVFTPLHGTGQMIGERALKNAGFNNYVIVPEQAVIDGDFPTIKSPNPESAAAFDLAIKLGKEVDADLLMAVDPDADRLGAAVRLPNGDYQLLTGNQIAGVLLHYILKANQTAGTLPTNAAAVKSIVSSEFATAIAKSFGVDMINVLTGFKYIAEQIEHFEATKEHTFMFGFEESYGYLVKPFSHDKDAIQTLVLLAEVAAYYKSQGQTIYDGVTALFKEYGYFREETISETFAGVDGAEQINAIMTKFRQQAPTSFADTAVVLVEDFSTQTAYSVDNKTTTTLALPKANVLKYHLADGTWIAVRPSGTEPKIKFYIGTVADTEDQALTQLTNYHQAISEFIA